jgi:hypothetical protein
MWFTLFPEVLDYSHAIRSADIDLSGCATATVQFELYFWNRYSTDHDNVLHLDCRDGDAVWHTDRWSYDEVDGDFGPATISGVDISACAGDTNARLRFRATGADSYGIDSWRVDDVTIVTD